MKAKQAGPFEIAIRSAVKALDREQDISPMNKGAMIRAITIESKGLVPKSMIHDIVDKLFDERNS